MCFKPHKPSSPAVCHSYNLLCCLSPDCRYCHANQGATRRKGEQNRMDRSFLYLALHTAHSAPPYSPPTLPPSSYLPFISPVPHPSFYVFCNRCNNRLIWKTLNYHASASSAHINAAETEEQIKLAEIGCLLFGETTIILKCREKKAALLFPAREFKMSPVCNMCVDQEIGVGWGGLEWAGVGWGGQGSGGQEQGNEL